jgi:ribosomal protein L29
MDTVNIRKLTIKEIYKEINNMQDELLKKKMSLKLQVTQKSSSEGINVSEIGKMKKEIAKYQTILNEKIYLDSKK